MTTQPTTTLLTVGHGALTSDEFGPLLRDAGITALIDIRAFPGSRRHPHFAREAMERWVPELGVDYRWQRDLGGRRSPSPGSRHVSLHHDAFRAYADHMESPECKAKVPH